MKQAPANADVRPVSNSSPRHIRLSLFICSLTLGDIQVSHAYMCVCVLHTLIYNKPDSSSSDLEDVSTVMPLGTPLRDLKGNVWIHL